MRVLVTGGSGFLARHLVPHLVSMGTHHVRIATRKRIGELFDQSVEIVQSPDLQESGNWETSLQGVDVIVHTAGRAHVLREPAGQKPIDAFRQVNVVGTLSLAQQAANAGVRRFIFISSIGVNGNESKKPFTERDEPNPVEPYAVSKLEAENELRKLCEARGMELTIIRPPLIYGFGAPGNFPRILNLIRRQWPLPLGSALARKSFIGVDNLCNFICVCVEHDAAANEIFLVSDDEDVSTANFLRAIGAAYDYKVRLLPVPKYLMQLGATLLGRDKIFNSLFENLQVDCGHAKERLHWRPIYSLRQGLEKCATSKWQE